MRLAEQLDFSKETIFDMSFPKSEKNSIEQFEEIRVKLQEKFNTRLTDYLKGLDIKTKIEAMETEEEVLALEINYLPEGIKREIADAIDEFATDFSIAARLFIFEVVALSYSEAAFKYLQPVIHARLQKLATDRHNKNKRRIITPGGEQGGRIIMP